MEYEKEELLFKKRIMELAYQAFQRGVSTYSDFLDLNQANLFYQMESSLPQVCFQLWGGYTGAERKMICFYRDDSYQEPDFPMVTVKISPFQKKFSDDLNHRDYLGAVLNLGIERSKIGDILPKQKEAFLFCHRTISPYLLEQLSRIRHTSVSASICEDTDFTYTPDFITVQGTVSSIRLDAVLAVAFQCSRSSMTGFILGKKVFINGRLAESNSIALKEEDIISVRGKGRFIFKGINNQTKKGRYSITLLKYQ